MLYNAEVYIFTNYWHDTQLVFVVLVLQLARDGNSRQLEHFFVLFLARLPTVG
jgi:hypothetical protein